MALEKITRVSGRGVHVPGDDVDTDRIIPARYLRCVTFDGLGPFAFYDVRYDADGNALEHPLNDARFEGASILLAGRNFGCGSSREHAPQSLHKAGFRAIIAPSFAEIFFGNCTALGVPCVSLDAESIDALGAAIAADPQLALTVDLEAREVRAGDLRFAVTMPESARQSLVEGQWDPISQLLEGAEAVRSTYAALPYSAWG
jgi:3-isopropylmalate/(R)-2-methylmalate dehydratase small subunit